MSDTEESRVFWERAGELGYESAVFKSQEVARHVMPRVTAKTMELADLIGVPTSGRVLELGCGDGRFAAEKLARHYAQVDACDVSEAAIARAQSLGIPNVNFQVADITTMDFSALGHYDACFLMAILHHVKDKVPELVRNLAPVVDRVVVMEPNGNHIGRKLAELTPRYKAAGEESFRDDELERVFAAAGYRKTLLKRVNFFPDLTPLWLFRLLKPVEPLIETTPPFDRLCTCMLVGFERA